MKLRNYNLDLLGDGLFMISIHIITLIHMINIGIMILIGTVICRVCKTPIVLCKCEERN